MVVWKEEMSFPCVHDSELNKFYFSLYGNISMSGTFTGLRVYRYKLPCLFLFLLSPGRVSSSFQHIEC